MSFCDLELLQRSYRWVDVRRLEWADRFAESLSGSRSLRDVFFQSPTGDQKHLLIESTGRVIAAVHDADALQDICSEVAAAAAGFGWDVDLLGKLEPVVRDSLAGLFGREWNEELETCWIAAFGYFVRTIAEQHARAAHAQTTPDVTVTVLHPVEPEPALT